MEEETQSVLDQHDVYEAASHVLPGFVNWMINTLLLPALLLAEGYLMGSLFSRGWVTNIETPNDWGKYHGLGVVLFFVAGVATAGLALRASVAAAACFSQKRIGFGLFNLFTLLVMTFAEAWSSFSERSFHLIASPADKEVLGWFGISGDVAITPTLVVVSFIFSFVSLSFGFSQVRGARVSAADIADEEATMDRKIVHAQKQAQLNEIRAESARNIAQTIRGKKEAPAPSPLANRHQRNGKF
jgi:hypothetical protein